MKDDMVDADVDINQEATGTGQGYGLARQVAYGARGAWSMSGVYGAWTSLSLDDHSDMGGGLVRTHRVHDASLLYLGPIITMNADKDVPLTISVSPGWSRGTTAVRRDGFPRSSAVEGTMYGPYVMCAVGGQARLSKHMRLNLTVQGTLQSARALDRTAVFPTELNGRERISSVRISLGLAYITRLKGR